MSDLGTWDPKSGYLGNFRTTMEVYFPAEDLDPATAPPGVVDMFIGIAVATYSEFDPGSSDSDLKSGTVVFSDTDKEIVVTLGTPYPSDSYSVVVTPEDTGDNIAEIVIWVSGKTEEEFTIHLSAAPGDGNSMRVNWQASRG